MTAITVTDSQGNKFSYANRANRKIKVIAVGNYPSHAATVFSSAVVGKRDIMFGALTYEDAVSKAIHHKKQFGVTELELILV